MAAPVGQVFGHFNTYQAAADDHDIAGLYLPTGKDLVGIDHIFAVMAGYGRHKGGRADSQYYGIRLFRLYEFLANRGIETDVQTLVIYVFDCEFDCPGEVTLSWGLACQHELTAQMIALLAKYGLMATFMEGICCLYTANTAAGNKHFLRLSCDLENAAVLLTQQGIAQAGDVGDAAVGEGFVETVIAALVAAYAVFDGV